jgi:hypothetical protein
MDHTLELMANRGSISTSRGFGRINIYLWTRGTSVTDVKTEQISRVVSLLERVASGEMEAPSALREWPLDPDLEVDESLAASWHELHHFSMDEDVRARDQRYNRYQTDLLREHASKIRNKYGILDRAR